MSIIYAIVGNRVKTPNEVLVKFYQYAYRLGKAGLKFRSGGALGPDSASELGCIAAGGLREIWRPELNPKDLRIKFPTPDHYKEAAKLHPIFSKIPKYAQALHARNVGIVLGDDLDTPIQFMICWTPDGAEKEQQVSKETGGTGTAIRLAARNNIPIFNFKNEDAESRLEAFLKSRYSV